MENEILDSELSKQQGPEGAVEMAGFWIRVGAALIDFLVFLSFLNFRFIKLNFPSTSTVVSITT